jgi:hypothetical protein
VEPFQNWFKTSGWPSLHSWAHLSLFNKIYFEIEVWNLKNYIFTFLIAQKSECVIDKNLSCQYRLNI